MFFFEMLYSGGERFNQREAFMFALERFLICEILRGEYSFVPGRIGLWRVDGACMVAQGAYYAIGTVKVSFYQSFSPFIFFKCI